MSNVISGAVAAIVDETTLVLNVGYTHGVQEGMVFVVFAEHQEVQDPDTGEDLGKWEVVKARVVVDHLQERMCTVRSQPLGEQDRPGTLSAMMVQHSFGQYGQRADEREPLDVRAADVSGSPQSQPIAVGDRARSLPPEGESRETPPSPEGEEQHGADESSES